MAELWTAGSARFARLVEIDDAGGFTAAGVRTKKL